MKIYFLLRFVDLLLFVGAISRYSEDAYEPIFLTSLTVHGIVALADSVFLMTRKCDDSAARHGGCFFGWFVVTSVDAITYFYSMNRFEDVFATIFSIGLFVTAVCTTYLRMPKISRPPPAPDDELT